MSEFGSLNIEEMQGEDERLSVQGQGAFLDQFVPMPEVKAGQTGSVVVRILPPVKGGKLFQYNRVHTINGRKIHCPRPLINGKWDRNVACPICDYYSSLWRQVDKLKEAGRKEEAEKFENEARSIKPVERYYYNTIVRTMTVEGVLQKNVGPRILSVGKLLHKIIIRAIVGDENEAALGDITHVKNGFDFIIMKEMNGDYPKYDRSKFARDPSPLGAPEEVKRWVEELHDLGKLRNVKDLDLLKKELAIHRGLIADESEGFNVDKFDAEYKAQSQADSEDEEIAVRKTQVNVPAEVPSAVEDKADAVIPESIEIDDQEFLKELVS